MNKKKQIDYKYSFFGNFSNIQNNIKGLLNRLGSNYDHTLLRNEVIKNNVFPVFSFKSSESEILIGRFRLDFKLFDRNESDIKRVTDLFSLIKDFLPDYFERFAINLSYCITEVDSLAKQKLANLTFLSTLGETVNDFLVRQNFPITIEEFRCNNVITIQTGFFFDNVDFTTKQAITFSIDVNTVPFVQPNSSSLNRISKEKILSLLNPANNIVEKDYKKLSEVLK